MVPCSLENRTLCLISKQNAANTAIRCAQWHRKVIFDVGGGGGLETAAVKQLIIILREAQITLGPIFLP